MVILTWRDETLYAVTIFAAILFLGWARSGWSTRSSTRATAVLGIIGIISIGVGIAILVWPKPTSTSWPS